MLFGIHHCQLGSSQKEMFQIQCAKKEQENIPDTGKSLLSYLLCRDVFFPKGLQIYILIGKSAKPWGHFMWN